MQWFHLLNKWNHFIFFSLHGQYACFVVLIQINLFIWSMKIIFLSSSLLNQVPSTTHDSPLFLKEEHDGHSVVLLFYEIPSKSDIRNISRFLFFSARHSHSFFFFFFTMKIDNNVKDGNLCGWGNIVGEVGTKAGHHCQVQM